MKNASGAIAQLVAHLNGIERVSGSNPLSSIVERCQQFWFLVGQQALIATIAT